MTLNTNTNIENATHHLLEEFFNDMEKYDIPPRTLRDRFVELLDAEIASVLACINCNEKERFAQFDNDLCEECALVFATLRIEAAYEFDSEEDGYVTIKRSGNGNNYRLEVTAVFDDDEEVVIWWSEGTNIDEMTQTAIDAMVG